ncbi:hypothetical protein [Methylosinus sp. Sm6]|uniref:hypothetical protein n=1 Tax=Methylosinus sp. Sm6 TaxID=2866948 RepID=UPI001C990595|nr:hypothetical protein [Methylosinus sp. Sm6]MBY6239839.1 hypothetical protein [Methylosinus sp. Sm6]
MKKLLLAMILALLFATRGVAEERTPEIGMPFCFERDTLQEFMMAMLKKDTAWLNRLKGCVVLNGGVRIGVIEDFESSSELGHVVKVRVLEKNADLVGYGIWLNMKKPR